MFLSKDSLRKSTKLIAVDFTQPWWRLAFDQKWLVLLIMGLYLPAWIFWYLTPFMIEYIFQAPSVARCAAFFTTWVLVDCANTYSRKLNARFQLQCIHGIYQSAHQYLLTIDPQYHVHRSSGAILGKIDRGARGYEEFLDRITFEFMPLSAGLIIILIAISRYSLMLAGIMAAFFTVMLLGGYYFARYSCSVWEKNFIETDDAFRSTAVENLAQVSLVRASFASDYMSSKLSQKIETNMHSEGDLWLSYTTASFIINMVYLTSLFVLIGVLAWQVNSGITALSSALGLAVAYTQSTKELQLITRSFRKYMRAWAAVKDLFEFMPHFGKQGYPVLGSFEKLVISKTDISIEATNISFEYETAHLFNNHTLTLHCKRDQVNKLYGIIGSSGSGKTTLISILGGQLKPNKGNVLVNGIDIYAINDAKRRHLIALQGQVATNMRGTVKYNLLFGLPEDHGYTDQHLLHVLEKVGLLGVLTAHHGLKTMLGEGGLNLSGGQRQRLNFAGLYLRACFYKPALILIDEPTSSLDELSEAAVTAMIFELAQNAITFVIAHRLKTIEDAAGLIDLSLLGYEKSILVYTPEELQTRSTYYCQLLQGKVGFDS